MSKQVASVNADCGQSCTFNPMTEIVYQAKAQNQLRYVSWPSLLEGLIAASERYFFDESAGKDIKVYVVDTGANLDHPVSPSNAPNSSKHC